MKRIAYRFLAAINALAILIGATAASASTRPRYGGTLRVMMQSPPAALELPEDATPAAYWEMARTLSLIGDTLVTLDALDRPQPALAVSWQCDPNTRQCQFTLRRGVKFHDGSVASPAAIAQILAGIHPDWNVRASPDSVIIETDKPMPSLLAELALPRNLLLKRKNDNDAAIGTGAFVVAEWQPGKLLRLAANEESWQGRPFVDAIAIEFGKSLRDQTVALELEKADVIETAPQAAGVPDQHATAYSSLPIELLALVFSSNSKTQDPRLRQALALAIDRKPIQSVLLKGAGEPAATILPNWMTGYAALFSTQSDPRRARSLLLDSRPPTLNLSTALNLSYDPRDPQAQLVAERIALNAREAGLTVRVSLSGAEDLRLVRVVLPSPDPATSLAEAARQLGLQDLGLPRSAPAGDSLDALYRSERALLDGNIVIPLFHLPIANQASAHIRAWELQAATWNDAGLPLADFWLSHELPGQRPADQAQFASPSHSPRLEAGSR
jgi:peptide/nickel transport system substrate-binding protein